MDRWTGAFKQIRVRNFADLLETAPSQAEFTFDGDSSLLKEFVAQAWLEDKVANLILNFPERSLEYVRAFLAGYSKFEHVLDCSRCMFARGALTWGLVDAYHASIVGARSISAALGVCIFNLGGRTVLVDLFPDRGSVDHAKQFRKDNKGVEYPIRVLAPTKDKVLEQAKVWALIERLFDLRSFATSEEEVLQISLKDLLKTKPWTDRHEILYDLCSWRWPSDIALAPMQKSDLEVLLFATDQDLIEFNSFVDKIYELNRHYAEKFVARTASDSIKLPAGASVVTSPGVVA